MAAVTVVLVLIMLLPGQAPIIYENRDIGTLGACLAVASAFLHDAAKHPRSTPSQFQALCAIEVAAATPIKY